MLNSGEVDSTAKVLLLFTNSATNTLVGIAGSTGDARRSLAYRPACAVHAQRLYFISKRVASVSTATEFRKMINLRVGFVLNGHQVTSQRYSM